MNTQPLDKKALRALYLNRRRALSPEEARTRSAAITARLQTLPEFQAADTYLVYLSSKDNEVDTLPLVANLLEAGKTVLVPISQPDRSIAWSRLDSLDEVAPTRFGILEPLPDRRRIVPTPADGFAVVPGIAFTRDGGRIGYGAGYYDRFLATFRGPAIGLAYDLQLADAIPLEPHDVLLDIVVTETRTYRAGRD